MGVQLPSEPITRKESYLAKAAGQAVEIPAEPITREEAYLDAIAKGSGGGGGTSDYNRLTNQPQINGTTLTGNKSASDLSLASTADLAGKVDKVEGYGLSENNYTDTDKAIVGGVTAALAGKQDALTAGDYIDISTQNEIKVRISKGIELHTYRFITQDGGYAMKIEKYVKSEKVSENTYQNTSSTTPINIDDVMEFGYRMNGYRWWYKLLVASHEHYAGQEVSWQYNETVDISENFDVSSDASKNLVLEEDLTNAIAGKQDALTFDDVPTDNSNNPVKSNGIYDALALKQNATDNSLDTDAKTIVGAINEHEGDIGSLKSGLTNVDVALSVPENSGKNLFSGSFTTTTNGGVTFTANSDGTVSATNTSTGYASVNSTEFTLKKGQYIFSGAPSGNAKYVLALYANNVVLSQIANGSSVTINLDSDTALVMRCVINGADVETGVDFEPMIRSATITDPTYAPYIPSVESRIEAVESGLTDKQDKTDNTLTTTAKTVIGAINELDTDMLKKVNFTQITIYPNESYRMPRISKNLRLLEIYGIHVINGNTNYCYYKILSIGEKDNSDAMHTVMIQTVEQGITLSFSDDYGRLTITNNNGYELSLLCEECSFKPTYY